MVAVLDISVAFVPRDVFALSAGIMYLSYAIGNIPAPVFLEVLGSKPSLVLGLAGQDVLLSAGQPAVMAALESTTST